MRYQTGSYRVYFRLGRFGIKIAKLDFSVTNTLAVFFTGIVMNLLERKRYLYYGLRKPMKQWGRIWKYQGDPIALNPTYFSCGLFNIVRHAEPWSSCKDWKVLYKGAWIDPESVEGVDLKVYQELHSKVFGCMVEVHAEAHSNLGIWGGNKLVALDYGDFNVDRYNSTRVSLIDYK